MKRAHAFLTSRAVQHRLKRLLRQLTKSAEKHLRDDDDDELVDPVRRRLREVKRRLLEASRHQHGTHRAVIALLAGTSLNLRRRAIEARARGAEFALSTLNTGVIANTVLAAATAAILIHPSDPAASYGRKWNAAPGSAAIDAVIGLRPAEPARRIKHQTASRVVLAAEINLPSGQPMGVDRTGASGSVSRDSRINVTATARSWLSPWADEIYAGPAVWIACDPDSTLWKTSCEAFDRFPPRPSP